MTKIKVLVVDDSQFMRSALSDALNADPRLMVVATAADAFEARDLIVRLQPQVMTLDVEMPRMDGLTFLKRLMPQWPMPVIMVSSLTEDGARTTINALEAGAVDFVAKPSAQTAGGFSGMVQELGDKICSAATVDCSRWAKKRTSDQSPTPTQTPTTLTGPRRKTHSAAHKSPQLIVIGASTGGTQALHSIAKDLSTNLPPIAVVQHMPVHFTRLFAERLNQVSPLRVFEASDGDPIPPGSIAIAPGGLQMTIEQQAKQFIARVKDGPLVNGHKPSCEPLFRSAIPHAANCLGIILTGMGNDGAMALRDLRNAGAFTIGQDAESCVVYGMPQAAMNCGAISLQLPLHQIATYINETCPIRGVG